MRGVTESMAGRAAIFQLLPLAAAESAKVSLLHGGFPEVVARPSAAQTWFRSYVQTYLERDVRAISSIRDLATFRRFYPGPSEDIEQAFVIDWARDPWAMACEPVNYAPGRLRRFWPKVIEPEGRVQFVGAYADNLNWGMEAATRSANRVARAIDQA